MFEEGRERVQIGSITRKEESICVRENVLKK